MKTKMIGLAAIMLALVMATGMASAVQICPFIMNSKIGVSGAAGWADHNLTISNDYFSMDNFVQIGNFNVTCECPDRPLSKNDAISKISPDLAGTFGTGTITTAYGLLEDRRTFQLEQKIDANKAFLIQNENFTKMHCDPINDLVIATEGIMDFNEVKTITTTGSVITGLYIMQNATMNATATPPGTSMAYSIFDAPDLGLTEINRACGAEVQHYFSILMPPGM